VTTQTPGQSAVQFQRQLGLTRYETAFQILHKLRAGMVRSNADRIGGRDEDVELDECLIGGATRGEGRGRHHMAYVVGAVEVHERPPVAADVKPTKTMLRRAGKYAGRLRLRLIPDRTSASLLNFTRDSIAQGSRVTTDDWGGYDRLDLECGVRHVAVREGGDPEIAEKYLPLIHLVFSNLKAWLLGTHHSVSDRHLQAYLNEFTFRFNRRFYPFNAFRSLLGLGVVSEAPTYAELYSGQWTHPVATGPWELTG
jgi:transposase-like protein